MKKKTTIIIPCSSTFEGKPVNVRLGFPWGHRSRQHVLYPLYERLRNGSELPGRWYKVDGTYLQTTWTGAAFCRKEVLVHELTETVDPRPPILDGIPQQESYHKRVKPSSVGHFILISFVCGMMFSLLR